MKKYIYFVSVTFTKTDGTGGHGMGEQRLDALITTYEQLKSIAENAKNSEPGIINVSVINYQLLRIEDLSQN
jgi:hypothetical protein